MDNNTEQHVNKKQQSPLPVTSKKNVVSTRLTLIKKAWREHQERMTCNPLER